jgi:hypothetical protein
MLDAVACLPNWPAGHSRVDDATLLRITQLQDSLK